MDVLVIVVVKILRLLEEMLYSIYDGGKNGGLNELLREKEIRDKYVV